MESTNRPRGEYFGSNMDRRINRTIEPEDNISTIELGSG